MKQQLAQKFVVILQQTHSKLKELKLSIISLGDCFVTILANGLHYNNHLEKLSLIGDAHLNSLNTSAGAKALASALYHNETLSELDLSNNRRYGDDGAVAIANAMHPNSQLKTLNLSDNGVTSVGAKAIVDACLYQNGTLVHLNLWSNAIADVGTIAIASALRYNTQLKILNLFDNQITSVGAIALADAFNYNKTLVELKLSNNHIADDGAAALGMALRYHPSLEILELERNSILEHDLLECLIYNESLKTLRYFTRDTVILPLLFDYNDTICDLGSESDDVVMNLLKENKLGQRSAPKKGLLRKQHAYIWLLNISGVIKNKLNRRNVLVEQI
jgi:Ran GTPase-activating protein (RanGAP) involved in mRNA processing and transport